MTTEKFEKTIEQLMHFAKTWNDMYAAEKFEEMKSLATVDVGIANARSSSSPSGLIYGRQAYYDGIHQAYYGSSGKGKNLLVMQYEGWEYIRLNDENTYYTIGRYTLQPGIVGVNSWLLRRDSGAAPWLISRVINN